MTALQPQTETRAKSYVEVFEVARHMKHNSDKKGYPFQLRQYFLTWLTIRPYFHTLSTEIIFLRLYYPGRNTKRNIKFSNDTEK